MQGYTMSPKGRGAGFIISTLSLVGLFGASMKFAVDLLLELKKWNITNCKSFLMINWRNVNRDYSEYIDLSFYKIK